jgi:uncharacterized protein YbaR (Trm112 family)
MNEEDNELITTSEKLTHKLQNEIPEMNQGMNHA